MASKCGDPIMPDLMTPEPGDLSGGRAASRKKNSEQRGEGLMGG